MADVRYKPPACEFVLSDGHIETDGSIRKKMSGSRLNSILGGHPFGSSQFQTACDLLGVAKKDLNSAALTAGNYLERPVIDFANEYLSDFGLFIPESEVFPGHGGEHDERISDWEDDYFSGNIDCMLEGIDGEEYIVDVKTTANIDAWKDGAPEYYRDQVALYDHFLCQKGRAYFLVCVLTPEEQRHPEEVKLSLMESDEDGNVTGNVMLVPCTWDYDDFSARLDQARDWYNTYIMNGISPDYDLEYDSDLYAHLCAIGSNVDDIRSDLARMEALQLEMAPIEAELDALKKEYDDLAKKAKTFMSSHRLTEIRTTSMQNKATLTVSERSSVDKALLKAAGIDPTPYMVTKTVETFSFKPIKNNKTDTTEA